MSSEILIIVPPEWVLQDNDEINHLGNRDLNQLIAIQNNKFVQDLNDALYENGYFAGRFEQDNIRVADVMVLDDNVYFKFGEV